MISLSRTFNFLIICYFFLKLEIINALIPSIWFVFLLSIIILSFNVFFLMSSNERRFLLKKNIWILISLITLVVYKFFDYGNFRLDYMIQYLSYSIPFLVIGYYFALNKKSLNNIIFIGFALTFISYFSVIVEYLVSGNYNRDFLNSLIFFGKENSGLIHFWPFFATSIILSIIISNSHITDLYYRVLLYICVFILLLFMFFSGYFSGIFFIIIFILSFYSFNLTSFSILKKSMISAFFLFFFLLFTANFSTGASSFKVKAIIELIKSGFVFDEYILNIATSNRFSSSTYSLIQFTKKPLYGHGIFLESKQNNMSLIESYTGASGGHSFFLDLLAFMGLFAIPIILIYIFFIKNAKTLSRLSVNTAYYKYHKSLYAILISVFISNISNSWLLFSAFDNFIFLLGGYVSGQLYLSVNTKYIK
jgi:hypothetical protein